MPKAAADPSGQRPARGCGAARRKQNTTTDHQHGPATRSAGGGGGARLLEAVGVPGRVRELLPEERDRPTDLAAAAVTVATWRTPSPRKTAVLKAPPGDLQTRRTRGGDRCTVQPRRQCLPPAQMSATRPPWPRNGRTALCNVVRRAVSPARGAWLGYAAPGRRRTRTSPPRPPPSAPPVCRAPQTPDNRTTGVAPNHLTQGHVATAWKRDRAKLERKGSGAGGRIWAWRV
jgi:hypothetical protein